MMGELRVRVPYCVERLPRSAAQRSVSECVASALRTAATGQQLCGAPSWAGCALPGQEGQGPGPGTCLALSLPLPSARCLPAVCPKGNGRILACTS